MVPDSISANPFIASISQKGFRTPDEVVPFDQIQVQHFLPALEPALIEARKNLDLIRNSSETPTFQNTIVALEVATEDFDQVSGIYFNLFSAEASPELQALAKEISPKASALQSEILLDARLFERVKAVHDKIDSLGLSPEEMELTRKTYKTFARNGALLSAQDKEKLRTIDQDLSVLSPQFSENVLKATNEFQMTLTNSKDLEGLPEGAIEAAALEAERKGQKGSWVFTLQIPSYLPFMQYAKNRDLRQKLWKAFSSRAYQDQYDNQDVIKKTIHLKYQRARLLGFENHADFTLQERMAESQSQVFTFLDKLLAPSKKAAEKDLTELRDFKKSLDGSSDLEPWDVAYYSEKLKEAKYEFNEEDLRPYFQLETVVGGVFKMAEKLYGLNFKKRTDVPVYHPDVAVYEVRERGTNDYIGLFYTDFFPRETKKGGAWMTTFRDQGLFRGEVRRPHVSIVCNFTKPTSTKPSLLSYDEVQTLFHEFGHALHGLLSKCTYRSMGGTNVYWDFVELPSQIMENWVREKEGLDLFAEQYETHEKIPASLVAKLQRSQKFQAGYASLRQINFARMDMLWYTTDPASIQSVSDFEKAATEATRLFPIYDGVNSSCSFSHIFAGGYSAGYYSYKWAEVLDADAFEYFLERGLFDPTVSQKFKDHVLSRGSTEHPMKLYKNFRGREPDPNALLRRDGLLENA